GEIAPQILAEINAPILAEAGNRLSCFRVQRIYKIHNAREDARVIATSPIGKSPVRLAPIGSRIKLPQLFPCRRIERKYFLQRRNPIKHAIHNNGTALKPALLAGVIRPRNLQVFHVLTIDLGKRGVMRIVRAASIRWPIELTGCRAHPLSVPVGHAKRRQQENWGPSHKPVLARALEKMSEKSLESISERCLGRARLQSCRSARNRAGFSP